MQSLRASVLLAFIMFWQPPWRLSVHPQCQRKIGRSPNEKQGHPPKKGVWWATGNFCRIKTNKPWSIKGIVGGILYGYPTTRLDKCMLGKAVEMIPQHHFSDIKSIVAFWMRSHLIRQGGNLSRIPGCFGILYMMNLAETALSLWFDWLGPDTHYYIL